MSRETDLQRVLTTGLVAVVRAPDGKNLVDVVAALAEGGVSVAEVTFTVPGALDIIKAVKERLGDRVLLGAGTVLDTETARAALLAGAEFIVSPALNLDVIRLCKRYDKLVFPGAFTPTEILSAWEAGADIVKVFPADVSGPAFFKAMRGPLPQIRLMPTGGVDLTTAAAFLTGSPSVRAMTASRTLLAARFGSDGGRLGVAPGLAFGVRERSGIPYRGIRR